MDNTKEKMELLVCDVVDVQPADELLTYNKKVTIPCYKKKQLPDDHVIVGTVFPKKEPNDEDEIALKHSDNLFRVVEKQYKLRWTTSYVYVGDGCYLEYTFNWLVFLLLPLIVAICLSSSLYVGAISDTNWYRNLCDKYFVYTEKEQEPEQRVLANTLDFTEKDLTSNSAESMPNMLVGAKKTYTVSATDTIIPLINPEENPYYVTYIVFSMTTGEMLLEETDLIEPGKMLDWNCPSDITDGDTIRFVISGYTKDTLQRVSSVTIDDIVIKRS